MAYQHLTLWLVLSWVSLIFAVDDSTDHFWQPTGVLDVMDFSHNSVWVVGSAYTIQWSTSTTSYYSISLWQAEYKKTIANNITAVYRTVYNPGNTSYQWTVDKSVADLSVSNVFYFELHSPDTVISSRSFNISDAGVVITTTVTAGATATASGGSGSSSSMASTTTGSITLSSTVATTTSASASFESENTLSRVALGVGLGVGIPLVLLAAIWLGFVLHKRRRQDRGQSIPQWQPQPATYPYHHGASAHGVVTEAPQSWRYEKSADGELKEVSATRDAAELSTEYRQR